MSFDIQNNSNSNPINGDLKSFLLTNNSKQKLDFEYGKKIAISINGQIRGTSSYFFNRNARFRKNRLMANGRMDIKTMFQDRMEMNGKVNYANISWKAPAIISTTISRIIGSWMRRKEKIQVILSNINDQIRSSLYKSNIPSIIGDDNICSDIHLALERARLLSARKNNSHSTEN